MYQRRQSVVRTVENMNLVKGRDSTGVCKTRNVEWNGTWDEIWNGTPNRKENSQILT